VSDRLAAEVLRALIDRGETVATAESLTGGMIGAALTAVPGSSAAYRGGLVVYATDLKASLAGVDASLLAARGAVDPDVAAALATGARQRLGATWGIGVTGVAGPEPQDGQPVGTVDLAVAGPGDRLEIRRLQLAGDRAAIRESATTAALQLLADSVGAARVP
jgi:nicotinamide-nucleotide amidase